MIYLRLPSSAIKSEVLELLVARLRAGQILVLPTDTIYGLSCLASQVSALQRLSRLKKRQPSKPFLILVSNLTMLRKYVFVSSAQASLLKKISSTETRPTTFIFRQRGLLPLELTAGLESIAVRLPKSKFLIKIIKKVQEPLVSTSLNLSGQKPIHDLQNLSSYFSRPQDYPDLVVDCGPPSELKASRLIDIRHPQQPLVLRK